MSSPVVQVRSRFPRLAEDAFQKARLSVVPRRRTRASRMPFIALVSMVLLGGVVGLLLFNTSMQQASFASTALEDQANTLAARQESLEMDLDRLRDPQRIAGAAQRLGMVQAGAPAFVTLGSGKVTGVPTPATAAVPFRINALPPAKPAALNPAPHVVLVDPPPPAKPDHHASGKNSDTNNTNKTDDTTSGNQGRGHGDGKKNQ
jgi:Flp pilus assembly protein TadG